MGFIFGRALRDEPECPGVRMQDGELRPCCGASPKDTSADPSKDETKRVVTLVHGTFARHAPWMRDGSELCTELRKELQGTVLRRFCWSGGNSHAARLQAGDDLAKYLLTVKKDFPEAQHFVIAHSHGGNVALYAMEKTSPDGKLGDDVAGIVTLATPFITLRKRQLPRFVIPSALFALAFIFVVSAVVVIKPLKESAAVATNSAETNSAETNSAETKVGETKVGETKAGETKAGETKAGETKAKVATSRRPLNWSTIRLLTTLFAVWFMGTLVSAWLYRRPNFSFGVLWQMFRDRNKANQPQLDDQLLALQPHSLNADKLLVMRPLGDEANMSLVISQSLSWMQNKFLSFLQGFQDGFLGRSNTTARSGSKSSEGKPRRKSIPAGCCISMLKLVVLVLLLVVVFRATDANSAEKNALGSLFDFEAITKYITDSHWVAQVFLIVSILLFTGLLAFFVIFGFLSLYALIGLLLSAAPFGLDAMFWNHFTSTTAEPAPVGTSPAHIFHAAPKDGSVDPGLAHSGIYTNPEATRQIVSWIKSLDLSEKGSTTNEVC